MLVKKISFSVLFISVTFMSLMAQQHLDPAYIKVTEERASKIVNELELSDVEKEQSVTNIIAEQYQSLSKIQDGRDVKIEDLKRSGLSKEKKEAKVDKLKFKADKSINKLHKSYLKKLGSQLSEDEIDAVKDGMTYGVFPKTYAAMLEMIPSLTKEEKKYIYDNLKEAREHAMDGGSSKEKHAWFGKYKGRINNYLSARGYDLDKERDGWYERIKERENNKSTGDN